MSTNAQIAYRAAAFGAEQTREADLEPRAEAYFTWLEAQPHGTAKAIGDAQAALLAASQSFIREGVDSVNDVTGRAARLLTDISAHAAGQGS